MIFLYIYIYIYIEIIFIYATLEFFYVRISLVHKIFLAIQYSYFIIFLYQLIRVEKYAIYLHAVKRLDL